MPQSLKVSKPQRKTFLKNSSPSFFVIPANFVIPAKAGISKYHTKTRIYVLIIFNYFNIMKS